MYGHWARPSGRWLKPSPRSLISQTHDRWPIDGRHYTSPKYTHDLFTISCTYVRSLARHDPIQMNYLRRRSSEARMDAPQSCNYSQTVEPSRRAWLNDRVRIRTGLSHYHSLLSIRHCSSDTFCDILLYSFIYVSCHFLLQCSSMCLYSHIGLCVVIAESSSSMT